jgi:hypothetical protein
MKKLLTLLFLLSVPVLFSQPRPKDVIELSPTISPEGNWSWSGNAARLAVPHGNSFPLTNLEAGGLFYRTDLDSLYYYTGTAWCRTQDTEQVDVLLDSLSAHNQRILALLDSVRYTNNRQGHSLTIAANSSTQFEKDHADFVADGTDDQTTINLAVTRVGTMGGGNIFLYGGSYDITGSIIINQPNVFIVGVGSATVLARREDITYPVIKIDASNSKYSGVKDVLIDFNNVGSYDTGISIESHYPEVVEIRNVYFLDYKLYAISAGGTENSVFVVGCTFDGNGVGAISNTAHMVVDRCIFRNSTGFSEPVVSLWDHGVFTNSDFYTVGASGANAPIIKGRYYNVVARNKFHTVTASAPVIELGTHAVIALNTLIGSSGESFFEVSSYGVIQGNEIGSPGSAGSFAFSLTGSNSVVTGNTFYSDTPGYIKGALISGNDNTVSSNNFHNVVCPGPSQLGSIFISGDRNVITTNRLRNTEGSKTYYGVYISSGDSNIVTVNTYSSSMVGVIHNYVASGSDNKIQLNFNGGKGVMFSPGGTRTLYLEVDSLAISDSISTLRSEVFALQDSITALREENNALRDSLSDHLDKIQDLESGSGMVFGLALESTGTYHGEVITLTAGENLSFGEVCYIKSDGKAWLADADSASTMPGMFMAVATISADASGTFLKSGRVRLDTWNWTIGGNVYPSTTKRNMTQSPPDGSGDQVQAVGIAMSTDEVFFTPYPILVELQ